MHSTSSTVIIEHGKDDDNNHDNNDNRETIRTISSHHHQQQQQQQQPKQFRLALTLNRSWGLQEHIMKPTKKSIRAADTIGMIQNIPSQLTLKKLQQYAKSKLSLPNKATSLRLFYGKSPPTSSLSSSSQVAGATTNIPIGFELTAQQLSVSELRTILATAQGGGVLLVVSPAGNGADDDHQETATKSTAAANPLSEQQQQQQRQQQQQQPKQKYWTIPSPPPRYPWPSTKNNHLLLMKDNDDEDDDVNLTTTEENNNYNSNKNNNNQNHELSHRDSPKILPDPNTQQEQEQQQQHPNVAESILNVQPPSESMTCTGTKMHQVEVSACSSRSSITPSPTLHPSTATASLSPTTESIFPILSNDEGFLISHIREAIRTEPSIQETRFTVTIVEEEEEGGFESSPSRTTTSSRECLVFDYSEDSQTGKPPLFLNPNDEEEDHHNSSRNSSTTRKNKKNKNNKKANQNKTTSVSTSEARRIQRECRGLIICATTGQIVARRFQKFFNIGERDETRLSYVQGKIIDTYCRQKGLQQQQQQQPQQHVWCRDKLDGVLCSPIVFRTRMLRNNTTKKDNNEKTKNTKIFDGNNNNDNGSAGGSYHITWATRRTPSAEIEHFVQHTCPKHVSQQYQDLAIYVATQLEATPLFEFCPASRIVGVLRHETTTLTLLAIRHNVTGQYLEDNPSTIQDIQHHFPDIPITSTCGEVTQIPMFGGGDTTTMMDGADTSSSSSSSPILNVQDWRFREGVVLCFPDGTRYKLKSDWYVAMSQASKEQVGVGHSGFLPKFLSKKQPLNNVPLKFLWLTALYNIDDTIGQVVTQLDRNEKVTTTATGNDSGAETFLRFVRAVQAGKRLLAIDLIHWATYALEASNTVKTVVHSAESAGWPASLIRACVRRDMGGTIDELTWFLTSLARSGTSEHLRVITELLGIEWVANKTTFSKGSNLGTRDSIQGVFLNRHVRVPPDTLLSKSAAELDQPDMLATVAWNDVQDAVLKTHLPRKVQSLMNNAAATVLRLPSKFRPNQEDLNTKVHGQFPQWGVLDLRIDLLQSCSTKIQGDILKNISVDESNPKEDFLPNPLSLLSHEGSSEHALLLVRCDLVKAGSKRSNVFNIGGILVPTDCNIELSHILEAMTRSFRTGQIVVLRRRLPFTDELYELELEPMNYDSAGSHQQGSPPPPDGSMRPVKKLFCGLDGILADFNRGVLDLTGYPPNDQHQNKMWNKVLGTSNFWSDLVQWMPDGEAFWDDLCVFLQEASDRNPQSVSQPTILASLPMPSKKQVHRDRKRWCMNHLGETDIEVITCQSKELGKWSGPGCLLIDANIDRKKDWTLGGGTFIHHVSLERTLFELKNYVQQGRMMSDHGCDTAWSGSAHQQQQSMHILSSLPTELATRIKDFALRETVLAGEKLKFQSNELTKADKFAILQFTDTFGGGRYLQWTSDGVASNARLTLTKLKQRVFHDSIQSNDDDDWERFDGFVAKPQIGGKETSTIMIHWQPRVLHTQHNDDGGTNGDCGPRDPLWTANVIILRGLPGSGKSTLGKFLLGRHPSSKIVSADKYFEDGRTLSKKVRKQIIADAVSSSRVEVSSELDEHQSRDHRDLDIANDNAVKIALYNASFREDHVSAAHEHCFDDFSMALDGIVAEATTTTTTTTNTTTIAEDSSSKEDTFPRIIVDNTNATLVEYQRYIDAVNTACNNNDNSQKNSAGAVQSQPIIRLEIVELHPNPFGLVRPPNIDDDIFYHAEQRSLHNVPTHVYERMRTKWEKDPRSWVLKPF